jgi:hypothetical protein
MTNYTLEAVKNHLRAMNCQNYQFGVRDSSTGEMINCDIISASNVDKYIEWLKYENKNEKDIYIRPDKDENRAIILVDDLTNILIEQMIKRGITPACKIETSPNNFQVWVSLGTSPMPANQRLIVADILAKEFCGDKGSVGSNRYGRLAGFTNRKIKYQQEDKKFPYVLVRNSSGQHAEKWKELRKWAERKANNQDELELKKTIELNEELVQNELNHRLEAPSEAFKAYFKEWQEKRNLFGKPLDLSIGDFGVACRMLKEGFSRNDIIESISKCSLNILNRKGQYILDYSVRTVNAAIKRCKKV